MKSIFSSGLPALMAAALCVSVEARSVQADPTGDGAQKYVEVVVQAPFDPITSMGLLFSERGTVQEPVAKPKRVDESNMVVRVPYREDLPRDTMATALLFGPDGSMAVGAVRPVFSPDPRESFLSIPDCVPEKVTEATLQSSLSTLESLVQVRSRRRGLAQVQVAQLMTDAFLERLKKLERGFGLKYSSELAPDMAPVELIDRLQRILSAIQAVKGSEAQKKNRSGKEVGAREEAPKDSK